MTVTQAIARWAAVVVALTVGAARADAIYGVVEWEGATSAPIAFADVTACSEAMPNRCAEAITGSDGTFSLTGLQPGHYDVTVIYEGGTIREGFEVGAGDALEVTLLGR